MTANRGRKRDNATPFPFRAGPEVCRHIWTLHKGFQLVAAPCCGSKIRIKIDGQLFTPAIDDRRLVLSWTDSGVFPTRSEVLWYRLRKLLFMMPG